MNFKRAFPVLLLSTASCAVLAGDDYAILVYPCPLAKEPPKIDGRLDEACWQEAPLVSAFTYYNKQELVDVQTAFRLLHDEKALYVGVRCDEPLAKRLSQPPPSRRDDHPAVFGNEALELFIDPFHDHANYYQIAASLSGTTYDGRGSDVSWNSDTKVAGAIGEDCWTLEIAVPWADLGLKSVKPGTLIGLNVCRDRNISDQKQWTCWSQTEANFHDPQRFGHVVLGGKAEEVGDMAKRYRMGDRKGPIRIFGPEGFSQTSYVALARAALKELDSVLAELDAIRQKEESTTVAAALQKKLDAVRQEVAPLRDKVNAAAAIDASEWLKAETSVQKLADELRQSVWKIRLETLIADI